MDECLGEICVSVVFRVILSICVFVIDYQVLSRSDSIIRRGRQIQDLLHLPRWMRVFSDEDPGMSKSKIRLAAEILALSALLSLIGTVVAFGKGTVINWATLTLSVVLPICINATLWLRLALSNRKRASKGQAMNERFVSQSKPLLILDGSEEAAMGLEPKFTTDEVVREDHILNSASLESGDSPDGEALADSLCLKVIWAGTGANPGR